MLETFLTVINFAGAIYIVQNGYFSKTKYFKIASFFIATYLIGILFKITHYGFGDALIALSSVGILLAYVKYFMIKPIKKRLDYLKVAWIVSTFAISLIRLLHLTTLDVAIIPPVIMVFILLDYFREDK